jgi:hypothetical protein
MLTTIFASILCLAASAHLWRRNSKTFALGFLAIGLFLLIGPSLLSVVGDIGNIILASGLIAPLSLLAAAVLGWKIIMKGSR